MTATTHLDPADIATIVATLDLGAPGSRLQPIGLGSVEIAPDAIDRLPGIVRTVMHAGDIVVLGDHVDIRRGRASLKPDVARGLEACGHVRVVALGLPGSELHADAEAVTAAGKMTAGAGCVVAVGSGTICDIAKEACRRSDVPLVVVQTACSVNAFSDDMAVLLVNGVKRTVPSRWPNALVADLKVIADAPISLTRAGVGELLAMFTAPADWRLAAAVGLDGSYDRRVVALYRDGAPALLDAARSIGSGDLAAARTLTELMTLSGFAMGTAGRTAPVSGTEHTVSHLLDMAAVRSGRSTGLHGAQVGVASLAVAVAWDRVLDELDPGRLVHGIGTDRAAAKRRIGAAFERLDPTGTMAAECWRQYERKLRAWHHHEDDVRALVNGWDAFRLEVRSLLGSPAAIGQALRAAGAPATFGELDPPADRRTGAWALLNGHLIRDRFTLADLAWFAGAWTAAFVDEVIEAADGWASGT
jgi:glycerol-1-phosphate dehydrogenase [NAD(P)+]